MTENETSLPTGPTTGDAEDDSATIDAAQAAASERERAALARLREALLATEPAIDPESVHGETLEELDASFKAARSAVARIREAVRLEHAAAIPAGAPGRNVPGPSTPLEKIKAGLADRP